MTRARSYGKGRAPAVPVFRKRQVGRDTCLHPRLGLDLLPLLQHARAHVYVRRFGGPPPRSFVRDAMALLNPLQRELVYAILHPRAADGIARRAVVCFGSAVDLPPPGDHFAMTTSPAPGPRKSARRGDAHFTYPCTTLPSQRQRRADMVR